MFSRILNFFLLKIKIFIIKNKNPNVSFGLGFTLDMATKINVRKNKLTVGENVYLRSNSNGYHAGMPFPTTILVDKIGAECVIGDNCRINGTYIHAQKRIMIGRNSVIAAGVNIIDSNGHVLHSSNRTQGRDSPKAIIIGENVWIGLNAIILKNTNIGNNSIVAAGSVVKGTFPNNVLIQGNPAKIIRTLEILNENCHTPS